MNSILHTNGLNVGYEKKTVIEGVDIEALKGQTICLIGPNGAGKSTILRTLSGMLAPVDGCVYIGEEDIRKIKPSDKARKMAVVLTEKLNMNMTSVFRVVSMGRIPYTGFMGILSQEDKEIVSSALKTVGAYELKDRDFTSLSDGEKQKVLIARALAQTPELIVLDEPTSHLDVKHKIEVVRILNKLANETGLTVILALHDIDLAVKFCQVVLMVKNGKIAAQGRPEEIVKRDTIGMLYDIDGAFYDSVLGCVEICNDREPEIYVAGGAGSGIPVCRMLTRMGKGVVTGILSENDIDYTVASAMKLTILSEKSFQPIRPETKKQAMEWMQKCSVLIDSGFPVGAENEANIQLLKQAAAEGKTVLCLRSEEEWRSCYGETSNVKPIASLTHLASLLSAVTGGSYGE